MILPAVVWFVNTWERARADVRPFLERERDLDLLQEGPLLKLLGEEFLRIGG
jgi:hypothetical protein